MKLIPRQLESVCSQDLNVFPILTVTGPRQSGKSTLLKKLLPSWTYVNLEDPSVLDFASEDPKGFLKTYSDRVVFDEIQRAPKLLSYLQVEVDRDNRPGRFALTGSHNLLLLQHVTQSLAGRTAIRHLLPFSHGELAAGGRAFSGLSETLFYGGYPPVHHHPEAVTAWLDAYIQTYIERDVRMIRNVNDLSTFRRFVRLCAGRASQLLDLSGIGGDAGVTHNTVRDWIGVLEAGFITFRLEPYYKNFSKRIIKSPKLYFYDTGLLCRLLDLRTPADLEFSPFRGAIFENWCVAETLKSFYHHGRRPGLYFWRDQKTEVDMIIELSATSLAATECKSAVTPPSDALQAPNELKRIFKDRAVTPCVVFGGDQSEKRSEGQLIAWHHLSHEIDKMAGI
jgi:predicted AAA+ superfamily ATPase